MSLDLKLSRRSRGHETLISEVNLVTSTPRALGRFVGWILLAGMLSTGAPAAEPTEGGVIILEMAGAAEVLANGKTLWTEARPNQVLHPGDRFRTKAKSRATLRLSDRSELRVGEESEFQVSSPTDLDGST